MRLTPPSNTSGRIVCRSCLTPPCDIRVYPIGASIIAPGIKRGALLDTSFQSTLPVTSTCNELRVDDQSSNSRIDPNHSRTLTASQNYISKPSLWPSMFRM